MKKDYKKSIKFANMPYLEATLNEKLNYIVSELVFLDDRIEDIRIKDKFHRLEKTGQNEDNYRTNLANFDYSRNKFFIEYAEIIKIEQALDFYNKFIGKMINGEMPEAIKVYNEHIINDHPFLPGQKEFDKFDKLYVGRGKEFDENDNLNDA